MRVRSPLMSPSADPARYERKQWLLPIPYLAEENISVAKLRQQALKDRREHGFELRNV
jgi:hypothetical protein